MEKFFKEGKYSIRRKLASLLVYCMLLSQIFTAVPVSAAVDTSGFTAESDGNSGGSSGEDTGQVSKDDTVSGTEDTSGTGDSEQSPDTGETGGDDITGGGDITGGEDDTQDSGTNNESNTDKDTVSPDTEGGTNDTGSSDGKTENSAGNGVVGQESGGGEADDSEEDEAETKTLSGLITFMDDGSVNRGKVELRLYVNGEADMSARAEIEKNVSPAEFAAADIESTEVFDDREGMVVASASNFTTWRYSFEDLPVYDEDGNEYSYGIADAAYVLATSSQALYFTTEENGVEAQQDEVCDVDNVNLVYVGLSDVEGRYVMAAGNRSGGELVLEASVLDENDEEWAQNLEPSVDKIKGRWKIPHVMQYNPLTGLPVIYRVEVVENLEGCTAVYQNQEPFAEDTEYAYDSGRIINMPSTYDATGVFVWKDAGETANRPDVLGGMRVYEDGEDVTALVEIEAGEYRSNLSGFASEMLLQEMRSYSGHGTVQNHFAVSGMQYYTVRGLHRGKEVRISVPDTETYTSTVKEVKVEEPSLYLRSAAGSQIPGIMFAAKSISVSGNISWKDTTNGTYNQFGLRPGAEGNVNAADWFTILPAEAGNDATLVVQNSGSDNIYTYSLMLPAGTGTYSITPKASPSCYEYSGQGMTVSAESDSDNRNFELALRTRTITISNKSHQGTDGSRFRYDVVVNGETYSEEVALQNGEASLTAVVPANYEVQIKQSQEASSYVEYDKEKTVAAGTEDASEEFVNALRTNVRAVKKWNDNNNTAARPCGKEEFPSRYLEVYFSVGEGAPKAVSGHLNELGLSSAPTAQIQSSSDNAKWEYYYEGLPTADKNGASITYSLQEKPVSGYQTVYVYSKEEGRDLTEITNNSYTILEGSKIWYDGENMTYRPSREQWQTTLALYRESTNPADTDGAVKIEWSDTEAKLAIATVSNADGTTGWNYTVKDLVEYDEAGYPYEYHIKEDVDVINQSLPSGITYSIEYKNEGNHTEKTDGAYSKGQMINKLSGEMKFSAEKVWEDTAITDGLSEEQRKAARPDMTLYLFRYPKVSGQNFQTAAQVGATFGNNSELVNTVKAAPSGKGIIFSVDSLPRFDEKGNEYIYFIRESMTGNAGDYVVEIDNSNSPDAAEPTTSGNTLLFGGGVMTNRLKKDIQLSATKEWKAKAILGESESFASTITVEKRIKGSGGEWVSEREITFDDFRAEVTEITETFSVPKYDGDGNELEYRMAETKIEINGQTGTVNTDTYPHTVSASGYDFEVFTIIESDGSVKVTNRLVGKQKLRITKTWNPLPQGAVPELKFDISVNSNFVPHRTVTLLYPGNGETTYSLDVEDLERYDEEGAEYQYYVREHVVPNYHVEIEYSEGQEGEEKPFLIAKVTNSLGSGNQIHVRKEWLDDGDALDRVPVTVAAYKKAGDVKVGSEVILTAQNYWQGRIGLDANVSPDEVYIKEIKVGSHDVKYPDGINDNTGEWIGIATASNHIYDVKIERPDSENGNFFVVTNRRRGTVNFEITKKWVAGEESYRSKFKIQRLPGDGSVWSTVKEDIVLESTTQSHTETGFAKYDESGVLYRYNVVETEVGLPNGEWRAVNNGIFFMPNSSDSANQHRYRSSLTSNVDYGQNWHTEDWYRIEATNKRSDTLNLRFHKIWLDDGPLATSRPDIYPILWRSHQEQGQLQQENKIYQDYAWEKVSDKHWICEFDELPRYTDSGYEYTYTIREGMPTRSVSQWETEYYLSDEIISWNEQSKAGQQHADKYEEFTRTAYKTAVIGTEPSDGADMGVMPAYVLKNGGIIANWRSGATYKQGRKIWTNMGKLPEADYPELEVTLKYYAGLPLPDSNKEGADGWRVATDSNNNPVTAVLRHDAQGNYISEYRFGYDEAANTGTLPLYDQDTGKQITYSVSEEPINRSTWDELEQNGITPFSWTKNGTEFTITNTYNADETLSVELTKTWEFPENLIGKAVKVPDAKFQLKRYIVNNQGQVMTYTGENVGAIQTLAGETVTVTRAGDKGSASSRNKVAYSKLPYCSPLGTPYLYYIEEVNTNAAYTVWNTVTNYATNQGGNINVNNVIAVATESNATPVAPVAYKGTVSVNNVFKPETVTMNATKKWVGDSAWSSEMRPADITLRLFRTEGTDNSTKEELTAESVQGIGDAAAVVWTKPSDSDTWTAQFTESVKRPFYKYAPSGALYRYFIEEDTVNGYVTSINGFTVTNTLQCIELTVNKQWAGDNSNMYGMRPDSVTFKVQRREEGTEDWVDVTNNSGALITGNLSMAGTPAWSAAVSDLPKFKAGTTKKYEYRAVETNIPADYVSETTTNGMAATITNTLRTDADAVVQAKKEWAGDGRYTGMRSPVTLELYRDGEAKAIAAVILDGTTDAGADLNGKEDAPWHVTWSGLPRYKKGSSAEKSVYYVKEISSNQAYAMASPSNAIVPDNSTVLQITNTLETTSATAQKRWVDYGDLYNTRPDTVTFGVFRRLSGETAYTEFADAETVEMPVADTLNRSVTFTGLPKCRADGTAYEYQIREVKIGSHTVDWTTGGTPQAGGYEISIDVSGSVQEIKNTLIEANGILTASKIWDDENDRYQTRGSVTLDLYRDDVKVASASVTLDGVADGREYEAWKVQWNNLPKYKSDGVTESTYRVEENTAGSGWKSCYETPVIRPSANTDMNSNVTVSITNKLKTTAADGIKTWNDWSNQYGTRPAKVVFAVFQKGMSGGYTEFAPAGQKEVNAAAGVNLQQIRFDGLPMYDAAGNLQEYQVREVKIGDYDVDWSAGSQVAGDYEAVLVASGSGYVMENRLVTDGIAVVEAEKVWEDDNDRYHTRGPVILDLFRDNGNVPIASAELDGAVSAQPSNGEEDSPWHVTWSGLPKYKTGTGELSVYRVQERLTAATWSNYYDCSVTPDTAIVPQDGAHTFTAVNRLKTTAVDGQKRWIDSGNYYGSRPADVTFAVFRRATGSNYTELAEAGRRTMTADGQSGSMTVRWEGLPECDGSGIIYEYQVREVRIGNMDVAWASDYVSSAAGNAANPIAGGYECYVDASGSVQEMVNRLVTVENITVEKNWDDNFDQDGVRPAQLPVELYRVENLGMSNETEILLDDSIRLAQANGWKHTWTGLPQYCPDGSIVESYRVKEVPDAGTYYTAVNGTAVLASPSSATPANAEFTNRYQPAVVRVTVQKRWENDDSYANGRPPVTFTLMRKSGNSAAVQAAVTAGEMNPVTVTEADGWKYTWTGLPVRENGRDIVYYVQEQEVKEYTAVYTSEHAAESVSFAQAYVTGSIGAGSGAEKTITVTNRRNDDRSDNGSSGSGTNGRPPAPAQEVPPAPTVPTSPEGGEGQTPADRTSGDNSMSGLDRFVDFALAQTGDNSIPYAVLLFIMAAAGAGMGVLVYRRRKRK